jgi:hypothetical protein
MDKLREAPNLRWHTSFKIVGHSTPAQAVGSGELEHRVMRLVEGKEVQISQLFEVPHLRRQSAIDVVSM